MNRFLQLVKKDLGGIRWPLGIFMGVAGAIMVLVRLKVPQMAPGLTALLLLGVLPFWLLWQSMHSLRSEWQENTVYTLLSLPVPGWWIILAKLFVVLIAYTLLLALFVAANVLLFPHVFWTILRDVPGPWLMRNGLLVYLFSLVTIAGLVTVVQLAFVVSKLVGRLQGFVALWTAVLTVWVISVFGRLLGPLFQWVPPISPDRLFRVNEISRVVFSYSFRPKVEIMLAVLGVFILTGYLLENFVETNE